MEAMSPRTPSSTAYRPDVRRGVVVPFTTPQLTGARLRVGRKGSFELLLRNPAGGKGVYLVPLGATHRFSAISLHDRILHAELLKLARLNPRVVRLCARRVALTGAAGHGARRAAEVAEQRDRRRIVGLRKHFLKRLLAAVADDPAARPPTDEIGACLEQIAGRYRTSSKEVCEALRTIADYTVAVGLPSAGIGSDHGTLLGELAGLADTLDQWRRDGDDRIADIAAEVARAARGAEEIAARELARIHAELAEVPALLTRWLEDRPALLEALETCDWLLDGWPERCALWRAAPATDRPSQRAALVQIARLLPPPETESEACDGDSALRAFSRLQRETTDWRDEVRLVEILERQEALRAELPA